MPRLCLIPSPAANALATGRNPQRDVVAVTAGMLHLCTVTAESGKAMAMLQWWSPGPSPADPPDPTARPVANQKTLNVFDEFHLRVVLWLVA